jgi:CO dehydrogenase maturation factor
MGRPEGPGCYCYVNSLLRDMLKRVTDEYDFTIIDNEAGMEHISRKTASDIDVLFVVSDFSVIGIRSARRIHALAKSLGINVGKSFLIINRAKDEPAPGLENEIKNSGLNLAGTLVFEDSIEKLSLQGGSLLELPEDLSIINVIKKITEKICLVK